MPAEVRDVAGLLEWLRGRGPRYAEALRDLSVVRVAVNQDMSGATTRSATATRSRFSRR